MDKNSAEYKTVINLYNDGRITEEERDKLLAALGYSENKSGRLPDVDDIFSDKNVYVDLSDNCCCDEDDDDEPEGIHISIDDEKSLGEFLSGLGKKIYKSAGKGMKAADAALDKASDKLRGAAKSIAMRVADELGNDVLEKKKCKIFDMPYDALEIKVQYLNKDKNYSMSGGTRNADKIKAYYEDKLDGALMQKLDETLDSGFTGKYLYMSGDDMLKISVAPPKKDDDDDD